MKKPKNETSFIKCYNNQRKIGLPKGGVLGGCPENENPPEITLLLKSDFDQLMAALEKLESFESDKNQLIDGYKSEIKTLEKEVNSNTQRTDELKESYENQIKILNQTIKDLKGDKVTLQEEKQDYKKQYENADDDLTKAMQRIGLSWGVLQNIRKKSRWNILIGGLDKAARELPKPEPALLPADTKNIIDHEKPMEKEN